MVSSFGAVLIFIIISIFFLVSLLILNFFVSPKKKSVEKLELFECGEPTIGSAKLRFNNHFFNIALVYVLFDIEIAVLIPVSLIYKNQIKVSNPILTLTIIGIFLLFLIVGFIYEWSVGNLDWIKTKNLLEENKNDKR